MIIRVSKGARKSVGTRDNENVACPQLIQKALSELSHVTGECREVSALAARGDAEGHSRRNFVPKLTSSGIIVQHAIVCGTARLVQHDLRFDSVCSSRSVRP
jgi:hypothetical protein